MLGCSLQYELTYTNVLLLLDLSGIPLRAADRGEGDPLVIAGGPCATHPEPCAPFFDALLVGDAERELPAALLELADLEEAGATRDERLRAMARRGGWYVPGLYRVELEERTGVQVVAGPALGAEDDAPMPVVRRLVEDLADYPFPDDSPVAAAEAIFDRMSIEIARGCTEGCRFCQAGMIYRPVRERDPEEVVDSLVSAVKKGGFDEASLTSLSTADYSCINPLIKRVARKLAAEDVSLAVSSLRAYGLSEDVLDDMRAVRAGGLTFAPEAGSQRMRDVVNKNVSDEDIDESAHRIFSRGWDKAKLYFMIGLPSERDEDVMGIMETGRRVRDIGRTYLGGKVAKVTVSVSTHVPKPHTPFQWAAFDSSADIDRKQGMLKDAARRAGVKLRTHNMLGSVIEAVVARGDRRVADVIELAFRKGCRFDGWDDRLNWDAWMEAFDEAGVQLAPYLTTLPIDVTLAWDHIDVGLAEGFLKREYKRALKDRLSPPCAKPVGQLVHHTNVQDAEADERKLVCYHCGVACDLDAMKAERVDFLQRMGSERSDSLDEGAPEMTVLAPLQPGERRSKGTMKPPVRPPKEGRKVRYRLRYEKTGLAALTGHLDLVREMPRLVRRAGLRSWLTQGFKPRPVFTFGPALRLGWQAAADMVDISVEHVGAASPPTVEEVARTLTRESQDGLQFRDGRILAEHEEPMSKRLAAADWVVVPSNGLLEGIGADTPTDVVWVRKDKTKTAPWSSVVLEQGVRLAAGLPESLGIAPDQHVFTVRLAHAESVPRPTEILAMLTGANAEELAAQCSVARTRLWLTDDAGTLVDALTSPCETPAAA